VAYLTKHLSKEYNIYISGGVINEKIDNITYIHLYQLQDLINTTAFHTIICSRYIAFFEMFKDIFYFQYYIWAHDTNLLPYAWPNQSFTDKEIITKWDKSIDGCICQTKWHAEEYKKLYPELKDKIKIINNGIDTSLFYNNKKKIKNRFIYTSRSERGLITLLEMWGEILEKFPDATLIISSYGKFPDNDQDNMMKKIIDNYDSISHIGSLSSDDLYNEMRMSEYWVYPTSYQETSCITAMEMLANGVICIYYPVAGLVDTMKDYGIAVNNKNEILDTLVNLDDQKKNKMIEDGIKYATTECSWHMRAKEWTKLFSRNKMIQVINLKRRPDRRDAMIKQFQDNNITDYDFFEAIDGKELKPTQEIKKMFEGNDFNYRRGVIGCALSHYNLWTQLVNDNANDFYLIMEDDITMCKGFNNHIQKYYDEMKNKEIIFFGYFTRSRELRDKVIDDFNNINNDTVFILEDSNKYSSGLFCYSINKPAAIKYIEHINKNSIRNALDVFIECNKITTISIINPSLVISSFVYDLVGDTNIQYDYDSLEFIDSNKNYIYINSFWYGFLNKADPNNISYFKRLISKTKLHNYEITDDIANANILIESLSIFGSNSLVNYKKWKYKIHYSGEPFANNNTDYDIVLDSKNTENNIIALPLFVYYINGNNLFDKILNREDVHDIPVNFCCFISSNPQVIQRRTMFEKLNNYKKVDSYGRYHNNMDNITISPNWWSDEYIQLLSKYKFMISFENTKCKNYITEKFVNPLLARTIPIYWGSDHVKTVFNPGSFLFLEDDTPESYDNLIQQIIDLDTNDEKYLEFINRPIFNNLDYWNNHYTDDIIAANIDKLL